MLYRFIIFARFDSWFVRLQVHLQSTHIFSFINIVENDLSYKRFRRTRLTIKKENTIFITLYIRCELSLKMRSLRRQIIAACERLLRRILAKQRTDLYNILYLISLVFTYCKIKCCAIEFYYSASKNQNRKIFNIQSSTNRWKVAFDI